MTTTTATAVTTQVHRVYIRATPQAVWDAITTPAWTERYGYGGRGEYDLRPGGLYRAFTSEAMRSVGAPDLAIHGEVIEADPPRRLVHTFHMVMDERIAAEGPTRLTYELEERAGGITRLTVIHDLEHAPMLAALMAGGMEDEGAGGGWSWILSSLKTVLETGDSLSGWGPSAS